MKQMWTVMRFEFLSFAKSPTFIGMTIFMVALALIGPMIPTIIDLFNVGGGARTIAVVDTTGQFDAATIDAFIAPNATFFPNIQAARTAVYNGDYNYALELRDGAYTLYVTAMGIGVANIEGQINAMFRNLHQVNALQDAGLEAGQAAAILGFMPAATTMTLSPAGEVAEDTLENFLENFIYAYVMGFVLYIGLLMGGAYLLTAVVREKSTKTMELLVTSCKPVRMLNGKVLGVGGAILTQLLLMAGAAFLSMMISQNIAADGTFIVSLDPEIIFYLVLFFLLGFVMYSYIYAALASTVSRMEDANSIGFLPQMLIIVGFFTSVFGSQNPGAEWVIIISHIPLFAPFAMFTRIAMGTAESWEIIVSIVAQFATIVLISYLGARIYRMGTLMYGNKPKLKDLLAAFKPGA